MARERKVSSLSKRLWSLMQTKGASFSQVAEKLGCTEACVRQWILGLRSPDTGRYADRVAALLKKHGAL